MKKVIFGLVVLAYIIILISNVQAAHFIIGRVNNSFSGIDANGKTIILWNTDMGINDNMTDIIGTGGNSGTDNIYMIDCELLNTSCVVGTNLSLRVLDDVNAYIPTGVNLSVSGAGFDVAQDMRINSPPFFINLSVDDYILSPLGFIDLIAANTTRVNASVIAVDYDGETTLGNFSSAFFDNTLSSFGASDDNNLHYTNNSCFVNTTYGSSNESLVTCSFNVWYYANSGNWNFTIRVNDSSNVTAITSNITTINTLLAVGVDSPIDFGAINEDFVSNESAVNVTNYGNVMINLSLSGYANTIGDGLAMDCVTGNISIYYEKYNLTSSNNSAINLTQFEGIYKNLTSNASINRFNLNYRQDDVSNEALNTTYWRVYSPAGVSGSCEGRIVFGASLGPEG